MTEEDKHHHQRAGGRDDKAAEEPGRLGGAHLPRGTITIGGSLALSSVAVVVICRSHAGYRHAPASPYDFLWRFPETGSGAQPPGPQRLVLAIGVGSDDDG